MLPARYRTIYALNPMVGVVDGFRWAFLGTKTAPGPVVAVSAVATVLPFWWAERCTSEEWKLNSLTSFRNKASVEK